MILPSIKEIEGIRGKAVLTRVDFNVPIERNRVADDTKIKAALPTIQWLLSKGVRVILITHLGKNGSGVHRLGGAGRDQVLEVIAERLGELLKKKVQIVGTLSVPNTPLSGVEAWDFEKISERVKKMKAGELIMLPNVRLHPGEEKNSSTFAKDLASLGDCYVNEAFPECHRKYASMVGVPKYLSGYAGLRLIEEVNVLDRVLQSPGHPFIALMGGGKITDKIGMMKSMVQRADMVLAGGALATHFFKAMGYGVGGSRIDVDGVRLAQKLIGNKKIVLPKDVVVGTEDGERAYVVEISKKGKSDICEKPYGIWDIGPQTILEYAGYIKNAHTLIWNGPMGLYEMKRYSHGTIALGRLFAARSMGKAFGVIGGGETIDAVRKTGMIEYIDFVSTGGGAMLAYLAGEKLPGIEALQTSPS